ncbi:hypothetical protein F441_22578, partial [Phytophthora nicotianae CJ01A1]
VFIYHAVMNDDQHTPISFDAREAAHTDTEKSFPAK